VIHSWGVAILKKSLNDGKNPTNERKEGGVKEVSQRNTEGFAKEGRWDTSSEGNASWGHQRIEQKRKGEKRGARAAGT